MLLPFGLEETTLEQHRELLALRDEVASLRRALAAVEQKHAPDVNTKKRKHHDNNTTPQITYEYYTYNPSTTSHAAETALIEAVAEEKGLTSMTYPLTARQTTSFIPANPADWYLWRSLKKGIPVLVGNDSVPAGAPSFPFFCDASRIDIGVDAGKVCASTYFELHPSLNERFIVPVSEAYESRDGELFSALMGITNPNLPEVCIIDILFDCLSTMHAILNAAWTVKLWWVRDEHYDVLRHFFKNRPNILLRFRRTKAHQTEEYKSEGNAVVDALCKRTLADPTLATPLRSLYVSPPVNAAKKMKDNLRDGGDDDAVVDLMEGGSGSSDFGGV
ncbi:hypothetical protein HDV00_008037 [Rhizophlyctis rosea]|nr:hypothetical protein HDV00_008037 [Rhizophlyctis rosea]